MYTQIIDIINHETNEEPRPYSIGKFEGLAWLYNEQNEPQITLKEYANSVNLYAYLWDKDLNYYEEMIQVFGKSGVGKSCIRIKKLDAKKIDAIRDIISRLKIQLL